jgi:hypothetical protein
MRRVQVFDVNETLLDLAAMDPHFERCFGDARVRQAWFNQMIQSALVATVTSPSSSSTSGIPTRSPGSGCSTSSPNPHIRFHTNRRLYPLRSGSQPLAQRLPCPAVCLHPGAPVATRVSFEVEDGPELCLRRRLVGFMRRRLA